jgi:hypothetical protein
MAVPWAAGAGLLATVLPRGQPASLIAGGGWLAGQVLVMFLLYGAFNATGAGHARLILVLLALGGAFAWIRLVRNVTGSRRRAERSLLGGESTSGAGKVLIGLMVVSLAWKFGLLAAAHTTLVSRCDDAISIWLFKAKVVASLDHLPSEPGDPYYLGGSFPHYPIFVPLLAAWAPLVAGGWEERLATLSWLPAWLNLGLLVHGVLVRSTGRTAAMACAYLVCSTPLVAVHIFRPGYADLILAGFLAGEAALLIAWRRDVSPGALLLGVLFAVATACTKREGVALAAICLVGFAGTSVRAIRGMARLWRWAAVVAVVLGAGLLGAILDLSEQRATLGALAYQPGVWGALVRHAFEWASFGLLFWATAALYPVLAWRGNGDLRPAAVLLPVGLLGFIAAVFVLTPQARFALNDQTPSRLLMQVMPAIVLVFSAALGKTVVRGEAKPRPGIDR